MKLSVLLTAMAVMLVPAMALAGGTGSSGTIPQLDVTWTEDTGGWLYDITATNTGSLYWSDFTMGGFLPHTPDAGYFIGGSGASAPVHYAPTSAGGPWYGQTVDGWTVVGLTNGMLSMAPPNAERLAPGESTGGIKFWIPDADPLAEMTFEGQGYETAESTTPSVYPGTTTVEFDLGGDDDPDDDPTGDPTPEPASALLLLLGAPVALWARRKK